MGAWGPIAGPGLAAGGSAPARWSSRGLEPSASGSDTDAMGLARHPNLRCLRAAWAALLLLACDGEPTAPGADVLLVVGTAPGAVAPAAPVEGLSFTAARTTTPSAWPALASVLTGRVPRNHGLLTADGGLGADVPTLPQALSASGYETRWYGSPVESWPPGLAAELDFAPADREQGQSGRVQIGRALDWLAAGPRRFAGVHAGAAIADPGTLSLLGEWAAGGDGQRLVFVAGLHGRVDPADPLRDGAVRVPLAILGAGAARSSYPASLHDLALTIATAVDVDWTAEDRAVDLLTPLGPQRLLVLEAFEPEFAADRQALVLEGLVLHRSVDGPAEPAYPRLFEDPARPAPARWDLAPGAPTLVDRLERLHAVWLGGQRRLSDWRDPR